jgi:hypothetical protein
MEKAPAIVGMGQPVDICNACAGAKWVYMCLAHAYVTWYKPVQASRLLQLLKGADGWGALPGRGRGNRSDLAACGVLLNLPAVCHAAYSMWRPSWSNPFLQGKRINVGVRRLESALELFVVPS